MIFSSELYHIDTYILEYLELDDIPNIYLLDRYMYDITRSMMNSLASRIISDIKKSYTRKTQATLCTKKKCKDCNNNIFSGNKQMLCGSCLNSLCGWCHQSQKCNICGDGICNDCNNECKICNKNFCDRCFITMKNKYDCGEHLGEICELCFVTKLNPCVECGKEKCSDCYRTCNWCNENICDHCWCSCDNKTEGADECYCVKSRCGVCNDQICMKCVDKYVDECSSCQTKICQKCFGESKRCDSCGELICQECYDENTDKCNFCQKIKCTQCLSTCGNCSSIICYKCSSDQCMECEKYLCIECTDNSYKKCGQCNKSVCQICDDDENCIKCNKFYCQYCDMMVAKCNKCYELVIMCKVCLGDKKKTFICEECNQESEFFLIE